MRRARTIVVAMSCLVVAVLAAVAWRARNHGATSSHEGLEVLAPMGAVIGDYVGAGQCAPCHKAICEQQGSSRMASALHTVEDYQRHFGELPEGEVHDSVNDTSYAIVREGARLITRVTRAGQRAEIPMTYVLGAGGHGLSFVEEAADHFREIRVSYYADGGDWDFTPSQESLTKSPEFDDLLGRRFPKKRVALNCIVCHSTLLVLKDGWVDREHSRFGVSCERCHGPGRAHIESVRRGQTVPPRNPRVAAFGESFRETSLCGECHGGERLVEDDLHLTQFAIAALRKSKCYQRTPGALRCTDCHNPHTDAVHGNHAPYVQVCLSCHAGAQPSQSPKAEPVERPGLTQRAEVPAALPTCPVNPNDGCIDCHMPRRHPIYRSTFTQHRIGVHEETAKPEMENGRRQ